MKRTILLILLSVIGSSAFAQMQQGTNYLSLNINALVLFPGFDKTLVYDRDPVTNTNGDTIPLLVPPLGGFRYQYAWTPNWSTGVTLFPSKNYTMAGLYGRYYFDLSAKRDYPALFVHVGGLFQSRNDAWGRVHYGGAELLVGQTFRRTKEPYTYKEMRQNFAEKWREKKLFGLLLQGWKNQRGRWGWQYAIGASASYGLAGRKGILSPQVQLGACYYFDSKGWVKRP